MASQRSTCSATATASSSSDASDNTYERIADSICSATTIRRRRDEWIDAGIFATLEQICLEAYDQIVCLDLDVVTVDGCIVKAPCGGEAAGKSPVDRGKQGTKRSLMTDGSGIPARLRDRASESA
jgi:transposase